MLKLIRAARRRPVRVILCVACTGVLAIPPAVAAQTAESGDRGGAGLHPVVGLFGGRFDVDGGPRVELLGGRAGLGLGELVQVTAFYWREVDFSDQDFLDNRAWGGEVQLNLNAGFGLTPFLTTGVARVRVDPLEEQTAAVLGAGLLFPLGPVALHVAARDYVFGVGGLGDTDDDLGTTHNWLFSAGLSTTLRRDRPRDPVVAAAPAPAPAPAAAPAPAPAAPAVRDTVMIAPEATDRAAGIRNFQSDQRIEVPLPLEGSITIRYGPEPPTQQATQQAQPPIIIGQMPDATAQAQGAAQPPAPAAVPQAQPGAVIVPPGQTQLAVPGVADPAVDRIVAALMPRLEAAEARRYSQLRADLNQALATQQATQQAYIRELVRAEVAGMAPPAAPQLAEPVAPPPSPAAAGASPDELTAAITAATARLAAARAEIARLEQRPVAAPSPGPPGPTARNGTDVRLALADAAARHPMVLSTTEAERGPAVVVADVAFDTGASALTAQALAAVRDVAGQLAALETAVVFVQGHTDSVGDETSNQRLSERRAETVRALLLQAGLDATRVHAIGFGEGRPIATNATAAGRALNRRVEIVVGASSAGSNGGVR